MLRIAICDDDEVMTSKIESMLEKELGRMCLDNTIDVFFSGEAFLNYVEQGSQYDLIYLDIEMEKLNGIEVARVLREKLMETVIIYISSYENYLIDLFEVEPFRFIKKPVDPVIFRKVLEAAYEKIKSQNCYFHYNFNKIHNKVMQKDIIYFESRSRLILIHMTTGMERFYGKLDDVEKVLCNEKIRFIRIHQSYLVNMDYVWKMGYDMVTLRSGEVLQISDRRRREIREKYLEGWKW